MQSYVNEIALTVQNFIELCYFLFVFRIAICYNKYINGEALRIKDV